MPKKQRSNGQGSLFRETRSDPIPADWTIFEDIDGKHGRRKTWYAKGRAAHCGARQYKLNKAHDRILVPTGPWLMSYYDHTGKRVERSTGTTDKAAAERILQKCLSDRALYQRGVIDARLEGLAHQARRPIGEHLDDFRKHLEGKGNSDEHVYTLCRRLRKVFDRAKVTTWGEVSASRVLEAIHELRSDGEVKDEAGKVIARRRGIGHQTFNFHIQGVKQFGRWMVRDRRAADNPLAHLEGLNVKTDRRRDRRALSPAELRHLIRTTETQPERFGLTGPARAVLYQLAAETGFRAAELRSLSRSSFDLDSSPPTVTVTAGYSKRKREDTQPLRPGMVEILREHLAGKAPAAAAFSFPVRPVSKYTIRKRFAAMFAADRDAAGIAARDEAGLVCDFHTLRHSFISNLAAGGAHPKTAQSLARHSTISLTMDRYTHQYRGDELAALAALPDLSAAADEAEANGTDGETVLDPRPTPRYSPRNAGANERNKGALQREVTRPEVPDVDSGDDRRNPLENGQFVHSGAHERDEGNSENETSGGDRCLVVPLVFKTRAPDPQPLVNTQLPDPPPAITPAANPRTVADAPHLTPDDAAPTGGTLAAAILAISQMPLTPEEKAEWVRALRDEAGLGPQKGRATP